MKNLFNDNENMNKSTDQRVEKDTVYNDREAGISNSEIGRTDKQMDRDNRDLGNKDKALVGIFESENEAIKVIDRLKQIGYREDDITVIAKDKDKMDRLDDKTDVDTKTLGDSDKVGEGAAIGGVLGGLAAALPALGLLAIPGVGPFLAAGPIVGIIGGVVAGGVAGGLIGALVEMGVDEKDAEEYKQHIDQGKIVILVENKDDLSHEVYTTYRQNNSLIDGTTGQR